MTRVPRIARRCRRPSPPSVAVVVASATARFAALAELRVDADAARGDADADAARGDADADADNLVRRALAARRWNSDHGPALA